ncbi:hypothetical protein [Nocardia huaxiensis]|uniref:Uncharacterized protein n=1 Tax=Nocardia huaxiensis TaxID=2755382 RepID=A0A7D6V8Y0_9NOCA|nr:hypothetical protein [Nocardia huaxiensis]QLY29253.1 hypothetical protein H0264_28800 [Nocardia huaxiensis]UFS97245.1 hypothetical protein LPY97_04800 [Nocardia huaxiensis]
MTTTHERPATPLPFADDPAITRFLALGDSTVRCLLDALLRLNELRAALDGPATTDADTRAAHSDLAGLLSRLETQLRTTNLAMLDITSDWPMTLPDTKPKRVSPVDPHP